MDTQEVAVEVGGIVKHAVVECARRTIEMRVTMPDGEVRVYTGLDYYVCLGKVREDFPDVKFLCKGAKLNVHTSRMTSQMSGGIVAYEVRWGEPADEGDIVNIFDYEDKNLTSNIREQVEYHQRWLQSVIAGS